MKQTQIMLTDQSLSEIIDKAVAFGRTRLTATAGNIISDGTRLIEDNNLPENLLHTRSVRVVDIGRAMAVRYSFLPAMAALREPGDRTQSRLVPTRAGLKSAPARLVYRYGFGVIGGVVDEIVDKYKEMIADELKNDIEQNNGKR